MQSLRIPNTNLILKVKPERVRSPSLFFSLLTSCYIVINASSFEIIASIVADSVRLVSIVAESLWIRLKELKITSTYAPIILSIVLHTSMVIVVIAGIGRIIILIAV